MEATDPTLENDAVEGPEVSDADGLTNSEFRLYPGGKEFAANAIMMMVIKVWGGASNGV